MNYDKERFLSILNQIKEYYESQNKMAEALGISSSYITKIYDKSTKKPPAPEYLKKIANNSKGLTTYEELMQVCGYLNDEIKGEYYEISLLVYQSFLDIIDDYKDINMTEEEIYELADNLVNYTVFGRRDKELKKEIWSFLDKYKKNSDEDIKKLFISLVKKTLSKFEEKIKENEEKIKNNEKKALDNESEYLNIPVVGTVAAGEPILADQNIIGYEKLPEQEFNDGVYFGLKIKRR